MKLKIYQHQIQTFLECREKFYLREMLCMTSRIRKSYFDIGSAFHAGVASWKKNSDTTLALSKADKFLEYLEPSTQEEYDEIQIDRATVTAMLMGYFERYKDSASKRNYIHIERKIASSLDAKIKISGIPDAVFKDNNFYWLDEEKTAGQIGESYINALPLDFQITFYFDLVQRFLRKKLAGVCYRVTRTPSIRRKKGQSLNAFCNELSNDYISRPDFYFFEEQLFRTQNDLQRFEENLKFQIADILRCIKEKRWYPNTKNCSKFKCEFIRYCSNPTQDSFDTFLIPVEHRRNDCFNILNKLKEA